MTQHLLVVEDSAVQAEMLQHDLASAGYEVTLASDGEMALEWLEDGGRPDAIITDVMMPGTDGYDLCRQVKRSRDLEGVPVILLTTLKDPVDIVRGLECGADNFVTKPYDRDGLLHRLDTVLRSNDLRLAGRFRMGVEVLVLGHTFTVSAERQQILDMLMSSFEELVNTNDRLREREEELEQSRDALRHLLEQTRVATWNVILDSLEMRWSPNAREVLGVLPDTPLETFEAFLDIVVGEDAEILRGIVDSLRRGEPLPEEWSFRVASDDGRTRWFTGRGHAITTTEGQIHVSGLAMDVTHRRELEQQLHERQQMVSGIIGASPDGILVLGPDGTIRFASDAIRDLLGHDPDDMVGRDPLMFMDEHDADRAVHATRELVELGDGVTHVRLAIRHRAGHALTVDARVRLLTSATGKPTGFVTVVRDVTDQARLETDLARARDQAETANRAKSDYLSRMSHELRTPMNSVLGFAQLLQLSDLSGPDRESVDRILRAGRHLLQLIDDVLDIARIEAGHLQISLEPVQVEEVVDRAVELLRPQLEDRNLELVVGVAPEVAVVADNQRLGQVLINLLSNAIKYNERGGRVAVTCVPGTDGRCRLVVADTGPGIAPDVRPRLFQTFDRLGADQTGVAGTGLGLALSKTLVEAMHGEIGCDSEPGAGSTFWVELPSTPLDGFVSPEETIEAEEAGRAEDRPATVLYVEDNPLNVELMVRAMAGWPGVELQHAGSGGEGLRLAREQRPDLVLLDLQLPGMTGRELLEQLRADPDLEDVPVVVLSADATMETVRAVRAGGADVHLTKPLDLAKLRRTVVDLLRPSPPRHAIVGSAHDRGR